MRRTIKASLATLVAAAVLTACGAGGYDRESWHDTFTDVYGLRSSSASCILDGVEANGLEDRFAGDSVEIDFEVERIVRACDLPIVDMARLGILP